jgi:hypothetical protein
MIVIGWQSLMALAMTIKAYAQKRAIRYGNKFKTMAQSAKPNARTSGVSIRDKP